MLKQTSIEDGHPQLIEKVCKSQIPFPRFMAFVSICRGRWRGTSRTTRLHRRGSESSGCNLGPPFSPTICRAAAAHRNCSHVLRLVSGSAAVRGLGFVCFQWDCLAQQKQAPFIYTFTQSHIFTAGRDPQHTKWNTGRTFQPRPIGASTIM